MKFEIEQEVLERTVIYLRNCRYAEVAELIGLLSRCKPIKEPDKENEE
jgi:hypothetical protein